MEKIQVSAVFPNIAPGDLTEFKRVAAEALKLTIPEPGTLHYDWFFSEDETKCVVREIYADSDAMLAHLGNVGDLLGRLVELGGGLEPEGFGSPSAELAEKIARSTRRCTATSRASSTAVDGHVGGVAPHNHASAATPESTPAAAYQARPKATPTGRDDTHYRIRPDRVSSGRRQPSRQRRHAPHRTRTTTRRNPRHPAHRRPRHPRHPRRHRRNHPHTHPRPHQALPRHRTPTRRPTRTP